MHALYIAVTLYFVERNYKAWLYWHLLTGRARTHSYFHLSDRSLWLIEWLSLVTTFQVSVCMQQQKNFLVHSEAAVWTLDNYFTHFVRIDRASYCSWSHTKNNIQILTLHMFYLLIFSIQIIFINFVRSIVMMFL